jgi:hypothetical protein
MVSIWGVVHRLTMSISVDYVRPTPFLEVPMPEPRRIVHLFHAVSAISLLGAPAGATIAVYSDGCTDVIHRQHTSHDAISDAWAAGQLLALPLDRIVSEPSPRSRRSRHLQLVEG